jgi:hypothetical protein
MGNGVRLMIQTDHFDADISLKKMDGLKSELKKARYSGQLQSIIKEKIAEGLMEFRLLDILSRVGDRTAISRCRWFLESLYRLRRQAVAGFLKRAIGGFVG